MAADDVVKRLRAARSELTWAGELLESPSPKNLDRCLGVLEMAASELANCRPWLPQARGNVAVLAEAHRAHAAVRRLGRLLQSASDYHARWNQMVAAMGGGYTERGRPAPMVRPGKLCLRG